MTAYWIDRPVSTTDLGWGNLDVRHGFGDPREMVEELDRAGLPLLVWISNRAANRMYDEGRAGGWLFDGDWPITCEPSADGWVVTFGEIGFGGTIDVYCRAARRVVLNGRELREGIDYTSGDSRIRVPFLSAARLEVQAHSLFGD